MLWPQAQSTARRESPAVPFQGASGEATVGLHVADFSLDGAAAAEVRGQLSWQAAPCAADQDRIPVRTMAAIDDGQIRALVGQDFHLFQRRA